MKNCIVAQSGGPTSVINASVVGVVLENEKRREENKEHYEIVYGGINGILGILEEKFIDLSGASEEELELLKYTPSSALGSCRYKLKDFNLDDSEYTKLLQIFKKYEIDTFFYIGGNDSMDTVWKISEYARINGWNLQVVGIPKTIDNDLPFTDHTPGFGSAAKYIATTTLETCLDASVYLDNGIFILEVMGRDTGWLAASSFLAQINGKAVADFIYLPERIFEIDKFLEDVEKKYKEQNKVFIVVSEGIKNRDGQFISTIGDKATKDIFGHTQLGGALEYLKGKIISRGITNRVKTTELGVSQRCAMHCASKRDIDEACRLGSAAVDYSIDEKISGKMVGMKRGKEAEYSIEVFLIEASKVANKTKYFPLEWINESGNNLNKEVIDYIRPLIIGEAHLTIENGLPKYTAIDKVKR